MKKSTNNGTFMPHRSHTSENGVNGTESWHKTKSGKLPFMSTRTRCSSGQLRPLKISVRLRKCSSVGVRLKMLGAQCVQPRVVHSSIF